MYHASQTNVYFPIKMFYEMPCAILLAINPPNYHLCVVLFLQHVRHYSPYVFQHCELKYQVHRPLEQLCATHEQSIRQEHYFLQFANAQDFV